MLDGDGTLLCTGVVPAIGYDFDSAFPNTSVLDRDTTRHATVLLRTMGGLQCM